MRITSWGEVTLDKRQLRNLMRSAANDIRTKTRRAISLSEGSGERYGGAYRASAPGLPPVRRTGELYQSIRARTFRDGTGFTVRAGAFYATMLEAGAKGGGGYRHRGHIARLIRRLRQRRHTARVLAARPFLSKVMQQEEANLQRRVRIALDEGLTWKETRER